MNGLPLILYDNRFADAIPLASSTAAGDYAAANLADWRPYTWWKPAVMPATVTDNDGSIQAADYCAVFGHNLGTVGATLEVRRSSDGFVANDVLVTSITPAGDEPILLTFATQTATWRIKVTGAVAPALAIVSIGSQLQLPKYLAKGFDPTQRKPVGQSNRSMQGQPLGGSLRYEQWSESIDLRNVTWSWIRATWLPAWRTHLKHTPWLFAWDPTDHADELVLVTAAAGFTTPTNGGTYAGLRVPVSGVAL